MDSHLVHMMLQLMGGSLETYLFVQWFVLFCVTDLFDGLIIRNLYVCSLGFTLMCLIYLMGVSLEIYMFVHWFITLLCFIYFMVGSLEGSVEGFKYQVSV